MLGSNYNHLRSGPRRGGQGGQRKQDLEIRVGTWNIGTLEAKSLELANELSKYRIRVAYVQETRWKGQKAKGMKGYKLWYASLDGRHNGVGILMSNDILKQLVEVRRCNDMIMLVRIVVGEEIIFIVNAYESQVGLDEQVKCEFWDNLGNLMKTIPEDEKVFLRGDFNGHISRDAGNYNSVHGGFGLGARNESGENLLENAHPTQAFSTDFQDKEENRREEGRVPGKDHVGETQREHGHNPVKQDKFIGVPKSVRECE
ncbi:uncharacterized protein LOC130801766 [Amaranthus tricolor]|uniref:uncharacterized protein LOC130801766 n=1 Tax=Amaranthus tricolor TaxID=29722 RepID=UPI00258D650D|nr:uncharacterized protein LOC130801766 [Amaranthus tricolor]